jgi:ABC-type antimicrobial peptide transport system permease subunit
VAAARRTASSYSVFLASTNPSDLTIEPAAIGFRPRQLQASVLWQAGIVAVVGIVIGVPLGLALGRWLWTLFAQEIGAVPAPVIPFVSIVVAALVALALAVGLSAVPGRIAARTPAVTALTAE